LREISKPTLPTLNYISPQPTKRWRIKTIQSQSSEKAHLEWQLGEARSESAKLRADINNLTFHQMEVDKTEQRLEALLKEYNKTVEGWNEGTKRDMEESRAWNEKFILYERSHSELTKAWDTIATLGTKLGTARETIRTLEAKLKAIREVTSGIL
jgi:hypothetical protein